MNTQLLAGKLEIQGEIAKGKTGTIYYGYDFELRQEVAIKMYHSHINGRLIRGKAFVEKSQPLLRLEHPNLIKIFKVEENNETPVVCMEFFDAPSLLQVIHKEGPLPLKKMLLLAREIAEVLVHIHFQGIIHGTLHPGHVLVGPQGQIKVMDLGLSWILMDILTDCDVDLLRPLPYLPPEIAKGELLTVSSDLYCLGFMMYDMLTQRVPYSGLPKTSIMGKLAFDQADPEFDFSDDVPEAIRELIQNITRNKSQHRLQDATHVLTILNQQLAKLTPKELNLPENLPHPQPPKECQKAEMELLLSQPPAQVPDPIGTESSIVYRPKHSHDYTGIPRKNFKKKVGVTVGIVLLLLGATTGYWYWDLLDIPLGLSTHELTNSIRPAILEPAPPLDSSAIMEKRILIAPPQANVKTEEHDVKPEELTNSGPSSRSSPERITLKPPPSGQAAEITPLPEPLKVLRQQEGSPKNNQSSTNHLIPVTESSSTIKPSSTLSESRLKASPVVANEPSPSTLSSEPATEPPNESEESTPASLKEESQRSPESRRYSDAIDASGTATSLPTDPEQPVPSPSAPSSPASFP